jgi:hypothetical protein
VDPNGLAPKKKKKRCRIYVVYTPVDLPCFKSGFYHTDMYVECVDVDGKKTVNQYSFGTDAPWSGLGNATDATWGWGDKGHLFFRPDKGRGDIRLTNAVGNSDFRVSYTDDVPSDVNERFQKAAQRITDSHITYGQFEHNSNAAASYLLDNVGLSLPDLGPTVPVPYTEFDIGASGSVTPGRRHLPAPYVAPRPSPGPTPLP